MEELIISENTVKLDNESWTCRLWKESNKDFTMMLGFSHDCYDISFNDAKEIRDTLNDIIQEIEKNNTILEEEDK